MTASLLAVFCLNFCFLPPVGNELRQRDVDVAIGYFDRKVATTRSLYGGLETISEAGDRVPRIALRRDGQRGRRRAACGRRTSCSTCREGSRPVGGLVQRLV